MKNFLYLNGMRNSVIKNTHVNGCFSGSCFQGVFFRVWGDLQKAHKIYYVYFTLLAQYKVIHNIK